MINYLINMFQTPTYLGFCWMSNIFHIWLSPSVEANSELNSAIIKAAHAWTMKSHANLVFTKDVSRAQFRIYAEDNTNDFKHLAATQTGDEKRRWSKSFAIYFNLTALARLKHDYIFFNRPLTNIAEHELGHAMGLGHQKGHSIMTENYRGYGISHADVKRLNQILPN